MAYCARTGNIITARVDRSSAHREARTAAQQYAPPGTSLHRYATELDLGPPLAYPWLAANHRRFGFILRYAWEPWHYELPTAHNWPGGAAHPTTVSAALLLSRKE